MRVLGLHHAQVTIPPGREAEARAFYCEALGLTELAKPAALASRGGFWLELAGAQLHVGVEEGVERAATRAHVAYEVDDLAAFRERLETRGFGLLDGEPIPGFVRCELRDPFGNRVELLQRASG